MTEKVELQEEKESTSTATIQPEPVAFNDDEIILELKTLNGNIEILQKYFIDKDREESLLDKELADQQAIIDEQNQILEVEEKRITEESTQIEVEQLQEFRNKLLTAFDEVDSTLKSLSGQEYTINSSDLKLINENVGQLVKPIGFTEEEITNQKVSDTANIGIVLTLFVLLPIILVTKVSTYVIRNTFGRII